MTAGSQQALSDAKSNAVTQVSSGMTSATNTAVNGAMGALNNGMQSIFKRRGTKPQADSQGTGVQGPGVQAGSLPQNSNESVPPGTGMGFASDGGGPTGSSSNEGIARSTAPAGAAIDGLVADVANKEVTVNVGQESGLRLGQVLSVTHVQRVVKDPVTGKPIRTVEGMVGEIKLTTVETGSAVGNFTGSGTPAVGDKVHLKP